MASRSLLQIIQQARGKDLSGCGQAGFMSGLSTGQIGGNLGQICPDQVVFFRLQRDLLLLQEILTGTQLGERVAVEDALAGSIVERGANLGCSSRDRCSVAALYGRDQLLDRAKHARAAVQE